MRVDHGVTVAPNGDQATDTNPLVSYLPAAMDKYVLSVGGVEFDADNDLVGWERSQPTPYVDVAGFANEVVGFSGADPSGYNRHFDGTAAATAIGGGVASLLKAENASLTGEDIDEILEITARAAGPMGHDDVTGAGAIDAGAALQFVRSNDIQRSKVAVTEVYTEVQVETGVWLDRSTYWGETYSPCSGHTNPVADLYRFTARVEFSNTFTSTPEAWTRWAESNGIDIRREIIDGKSSAYYDPFNKNLQVTSVDATGMVVEGHYWKDAQFYNYLGQRCPAAGVDMPASPENFDIAYTAVGTEGAASPPDPPSNLVISNRNADTELVELQWQASPTPGVSYRIYRRTNPQYGSPSPWGQIGTASSTTYTDYDVLIDPYPTPDHENFEYRVSAVKFGLGSGYSNTVSIYAYPLVPTGSDSTLTVSSQSADGGAAGASQRLERRPEAFSLTSYPNPVRQAARFDVALPKATHVELVVYDALGREVRRLLGKKLPAGRHQVRLKAGGLSSGVYVYRFRAGETFAKTGKIVVVK